MALKHIGKTIEKIMFKCKESGLLIHCAVRKTKTQLVNGPGPTNKTVSTREKK